MIESGFHEKVDIKRLEYNSADRIKKNQVRQFITIDADVPCRIVDTDNNNVIIQFGAAVKVEKGCIAVNKSENKSYEIIDVQLKRRLKDIHHIRCICRFAREKEVLTNA